MKCLKAKTSWNDRPVSSRFEQPGDILKTLVNEVERYVDADDPLLADPCLHSPGKHDFLHGAYAGATHIDKACEEHIAFGGRIVATILLWCDVIQPKTILRNFVQFSCRAYGIEAVQWMSIDLGAFNLLCCSICQDIHCPIQH